MPIVMADVIAALPGGGLHCDDLVVEIEISGSKFASDGHQDPVRATSAPLTNHGVIVGAITVGYKSSQPTRDKRPFPDEEVRLLEGIAFRLSDYVQRMRTEEALRESEER